jgi:hypothetical protein
MRLSIFGEVEKFVTIRPSQVRLRGAIGEKIKRRVTIIPTPKYPFKIVKVRVRDGKDIAYQLAKIRADRRK